MARFCAGAPRTGLPTIPKADARARIFHHRFPLALHANALLSFAHRDAKRKLGSHIFYFNTDQDWNPTWGGQTLVFDDDGRFGNGSRPQFEDFARSFASNAVGNNSFLFSN